MSYYQHHVFFCCNQRKAGEACCADRGASEMRDYAKKRLKELRLDGPARNRINMAGCLDRCELGPVIVVYPEEIWYTYVDKEDIDEIIDEHLQHGRVVERLRLPDAGTNPGEADCPKMAPYLPRVKTLR